MFYKKMSDFVTFPMFGLTEVIKLRNFDLKVIKITLIFFDKKRCKMTFLTVSD